MASDLRLLVVGDIFGGPPPDVCLSKAFPTAQITRHDLATLVGRPDLSGEALHRHLFAEGGMAQVLETLSRTLNAPTFALGYSAGGTALWRLARVVPLSGLICISSTRLRDESPLPIPTVTLFGGDDPNRPRDDWCAKVPSHSEILPNAAHGFYSDSTSEPYKQAQRVVCQTLTAWHQN
ncbi:MAG: alpha/beta hydrolase [Shimia sp.]|nr:alpha/beta hydrolase [Shimia sp.]